MKMHRLATAGALIALLLGGAGPVNSGLADVKDCGSSEGDIRGVTNDAASDWDSFEAKLEEVTGLNIKKCMRNRFKKNGKVVCESKDTGLCDGSNAWASPFNRKVHLCPSFINRVSSWSKKPDRKACILAVVAHEFAHSCDRFEAGAESIDDAAFEWFEESHTLSKTLSDCGT